MRPVSRPLAVPASSSGAKPARRSAPMGAASASAPSAATSPDTARSKLAGRARSLVSRSAKVDAASGTVPWGVRASPPSRATDSAVPA